MDKLGQSGLRKFPVEYYLRDGCRHEFDGFRKDFVMGKEVRRCIKCGDEFPLKEKEWKKK